MVSFDAKRRFAGDAARTQQVGNFRNTVCNLPRLIGRLSNESAVKVETEYETCRLGDVDGLLGAKVSYRGSEKTFTNTELTAMFLNKLKAITHAETKTAVSDVVISVPSYFAEKERRALVDAAEIAGLNCLRTVNDTTAAAVNYGMMKTDTLSDSPKNVIILDIGYSSLKACLASFVRGQVDIKAHVFDMHLGGRDFDEVLVKHFVEHFLKQRKVDIRENKKALLRMRIGCERMKKVLSGIQMTRLELEALIEGADFPLEASRQLLEELSVELLGRIERKLEELVQLSGISSFEQVDAIEIIGGTTRIPAIKSLITRLFGKEPSTTLNADEAVSRGCALICAIDSPLVRVREYKINDMVNFPIKLTLKSSQGQFLGQLEAPRGTLIDQNCSGVIPLPSTQLFPLIVEAHYTDLSALPTEIPSQISKFTLSLPRGASIPDESGKFSVSFKLTSSSILQLEKAQIETESLAATSSASQGESEVAETTAPQEEEESEEENTSSVESEKAKAMQGVTYDLDIKSETFRLPRPTIAKMKDAEINMTLHDKLVAEIDDRRNAVEEFIYETRNNLEESFGTVSTEEEREAVRKSLGQAEDWLYDEGADLGKDAYIKKLDELKALVKPFSTRLIEQARAAATPKDEPTIEQPNQSDQSSETRSKTDIPQMDMD